MVFRAAGSFVTTESVAPSRRASSSLLFDVLRTVTFAPLDAASFTAM